MSAFYNENDPKAAAWLRELITAGLIAPGIVDERSITDISPTDLHGFTQCHFFAGIGGWSYALRLAGIPDSLPVWTGSCPCQPFSAAGKGGGTKDDRHLWPSFARLIDFCQPPTVFGEQVASKDGRLWLAGIFADLEGMGYSRAAADLCAAGVGAPHIRQRLYWAADAASEGRHGASTRKESAGRRIVAGNGGARRLDNSHSLGAERTGTGKQVTHAGRAAGDDGMEHAPSNGREQRRAESGGRSIAVGCGAWDSAILLPCTDGKARRVEPGSFPLAHGIPGRVAQLRGLGNAIVPQVAAEFVQAFYETLC